MALLLACWIVIREIRVEIPRRAKMWLTLHSLHTKDGLGVAQGTALLAVVVIAAAVHSFIHSFIHSFKDLYSTSSR